MVDLAIARDETKVYMLEEISEQAEPLSVKRLTA